MRCLAALLVLSCAAGARGEPPPAQGDFDACAALAQQAQGKDAAACFDRLHAADPKSVNLAYNAGLSHYLAGDFQRAAERWTAAAKLAPDDFQLATKVLQAWHGLGSVAEADRARDRVLALWKQGRAAGAKEFVFDQFVVGGHRVFATETIEIGGKIAYVYRFDVSDKVDGVDKKIGSVNLETSEVIRAAGRPYLLGMDYKGKHTQLGRTWKTLPSYQELKPIVIEAIKARF